MSAAVNGQKTTSFDRIVATAASAGVFGLVGYLLIRNEPISDPRLFFALRLVLSFSTAALGATIPGFLNVRWTGNGLVIRAGGALALFLLTYVYTPDLYSGHIEQRPLQINQKAGPFSSNSVDNRGEITITGPRVTDPNK
ncbi:hypothetical protein [Bradyrhizobium sp.]